MANCLVPQGLNVLDWYGDLYPAFSDKPHFPLDRLNLNPTPARGNHG